MEQMENLLNDFKLYHPVAGALLDECTTKIELTDHGFALRIGVPTDYFYEQISSGRYSEIIRDYFSGALQKPVTINCERNATSPWVEINHAISETQALLAALPRWGCAYGGHRDGEIVSARAGGEVVYFEVKCKICNKIDLPGLRQADLLKLLRLIG